MLFHWIVSFSTGAAAAAGVFKVVLPGSRILLGTLSQLGLNILIVHNLVELLFLCQLPLSFPLPVANH